MTQEDEELEISILVIDYISKSIYLKFDEDSEVLNWQHIIKAETVNTSPHLKDRSYILLNKTLSIIYNINIHIHSYIYVIRMYFCT